jgi:quinol monooxygenase YgiN
MTVVLAILKATPEQAAEVERSLLALRQQTATEPGCLSYAVHRQEDHGFLVYERYTDHAARDAHFAAAHTTAFLARLPELLTADPQVEFGDEVHNGMSDAFHNGGSDA